MRQTAEQREYHEALLAVVRPVLGERARIIRDAEGFSIVPGRLGPLEYLGPERDGSERLYVFTARPRIVAKVAAVPGVRRHQIGDVEAPLWFVADDADALRAVAVAVGTRIRRNGSAASVAALARARETSSARREDRVISSIREGKRWAIAGPRADEASASARHEACG